MTPEELKAVESRLAEPFDPAEVKWKAQTASGNRCLAVAYIDARTVMDRLDAVLGLDGWQDGYELLPGGSVLCRLRVRLGGVWVEKSDVGSPSEQPDEGDQLKAALSDSLKRAAVHYSIGRYLYRLPKQWVAYDPQKKRIVGTPTLPPDALPRQAAPAKKGLPADGAELLRRLQELDARLLHEGVTTTAGELIAHVKRAGRGLGLPAKVESWAGEPAMRLAADAARAFEQEHRGLSPAQQKELEELCEARAADWEPLCRHLGFKGAVGVTDLRQPHYQRALDWLQSQPVPAAAAN